MQMKAEKKNKKQKKKQMNIINKHEFTSMFNTYTYTYIYILPMYR